MDRYDPAGNIVTVQECVCGWCEEVEHIIGTKTEAIRQLRKTYKWMKTKSHGWVCRECADLRFRKVNPIR